MERIQIVHCYFDAHNASAADRVSEIFAEDAIVVNVNFPPFRGREKVLAFCHDLYARTASRDFRVMVLAETGNTMMVHWEAQLMFRPGARIGPYELARGFEARLEGMSRFTFNSDGLVSELKIFHETTTVAQLAAANARLNGV